MKCLTLIVNGFCVPFADGSAVNIDFEVIFHFIINNTALVGNPSIIAVHFKTVNIFFCRTWYLG